jgi:pyruvate/2-oxoglutarate dehydrogenase complex dihydrolipoamide dehydrogenase (E3) component
MQEEGVECDEGAVDTIAGVNRVEAVLSGGRVYACDGVVAFPRLVPAVPRSPLTLGHQGGVLVDSGMRTSTEGVFAAGDCVEIKYRSSSLSARLESSAKVMGSVAGVNAAGGRATARISGAISHAVFGVEICGAGVGSSQARAAGLDPVEVTSELPGRGAPFGHEEILCTIVFDRSTRAICGLFLAGWRASSYGDAISLIVSSGLRPEEISYFDSPYSPKNSPDLSPITLTARKAAAVTGELR